MNQSSTPRTVLWADRTGESVSKVVTDSAYESFDNYESIEAIGAEPVVPPRTDAAVREHGNKNKKPIARDKVVQAIQETTREKWKQEKGYHVRSLV
ncbi:MAG: hypothetical protein P8104_12900, partial [Gammaproteobacteria bacterium]